MNPWEISKDDYPFLLTRGDGGKENYLSWLDSKNIQYNVLKIEVHGTWINQNKKGNMSAKSAVFIKNPVTLLVKCDLCNLWGGPNKTKERGDAYGWNFEGINDYTTKSKHVLCTCCWGKVRRIVNGNMEAQQLKLIINKLNREITKWQKLNLQAV